MAGGMTGGMAGGMAGMTGMAGKFDLLLLGFGVPAAGKTWSARTRARASARGSTHQGAEK